MRKIIVALFLLLSGCETKNKLQKFDDWAQAFSGENSVYVTTAQVEPYRPTADIKVYACVVTCDDFADIPKHRIPVIYEDDGRPTPFATWSTAGNLVTVNFYNQKSRYKWIVTSIPN